MNKDNPFSSSPRDPEARKDHHRAADHRESVGLSSGPINEAMTDPAPSGIEILIAVMAALRDPVHGCPWDREQSFETIAPYTIEEAYEVADAIHSGERGDGLRDEIGDLLFQVVYYAQLSREQGGFDFDAIARAAARKMIRRHPHVFPASVFPASVFPESTPHRESRQRLSSSLGGADGVAGTTTIDNAEDQTRAWESYKETERAQRREARQHRAQATDTGDASAPLPNPGRDPARTEEPSHILDGIARALPALIRADKLGKRAARAGFDWPDPLSVLAKVDEEIGELSQELGKELCHGRSSERIEEELGDLLFSCANLARKLTIDPEAALRKANDKFTRRFAAVETHLARQGRSFDDAGMEELERLWETVKAEENHD